MYQPIRLSIHFYTVLHFNIPIQWFRYGKLVSIFIVYHILVHYCINIALKTYLFLLDAGMLNYAETYYSIFLSIIQYSLK